VPKTPGKQGFEPLLAALVKLIVALTAVVKVFPLWSVDVPEPESVIVPLQL
jgi:hypothetical protein